MVFKILLGVVYLLQIIFGPLYSYPKFKAVSHLFHKQACAALYVLTGVLSMLIMKNYCLFAAFMIIGAVFSWGGDLLLNLTKDIEFAIGTLLFLTAHIFYLCAYSRALDKLYGIGFWSLRDFIIIVAVMIGIFLLFRMKMFDFKKLKPGIMLYAAVITTMTVKAFELAYYTMTAPGGSKALAICLSAGSLLFLISDFTLVFIVFAHKTANKYAALNMNTYYAGQMLLASTVLFVNV